jgi:hypothetical protein
MELSIAIIAVAGQADKEKINRNILIVCASCLIYIVVIFAFRDIFSEQNLASNNQGVSMFSQNAATIDIEKYMIKNNVTKFIRNAPDLADEQNSSKGTYNDMITAIKCYYDKNNNLNYFESYLIIIENNVIVDEIYMNSFSHYVDTDKGEYRTTGINPLNQEKTDNILFIDTPNKTFNTADAINAVTNTNMTVTTAAGTFTDCIEVTEPALEGANYAGTKTYYAPNIGEIVSFAESEFGNEDYSIKLSELILVEDITE